MSTLTDLQLLVTAGAEALDRGDAAVAKGLFEKVVAAGRADAGVWLGLATANRILGDEAGKTAALDALLAIDPGNARALAMKTDPAS